MTSFQEIYIQIRTKMISIVDFLDLYPTGLKYETIMFEQILFPKMPAWKRNIRFWLEQDLPVYK